MPSIYAHRGASVDRPENTLPAFARAVHLQAYGIELDVHLTRDGVPVVIHDETVDRTTNGHGAIAEMDLADVRRLDAGGSATVPTLDEVLDTVGASLHVDIEVKAAEAADAVLVAAARRPELRFAVSSFDHDVLRHVHRQAPAIELWPLVVGASDEALATAAEFGSPCLAIHDGFVNAEIVAYLHSRNLKAWVWTVNDVERALTLASLGVAGICTDDPASLLAAMRGEPSGAALP